MFTMCMLRSDTGPTGIKQNITGNSTGFYLGELSAEDESLSYNQPRPQEASQLLPLGCKARA